MRQPPELHLLSQYEESYLLKPNSVETRVYLRAYGFATLPFHCLLDPFEGEYLGWPRIEEPQLHSLKADPRLVSAADPDRIF
jgi:hypothetical protein